MQDTTIMEAHISSMEQLMESLIAPLDDEGRWKVFDALLEARGFDRMERTIGPNHAKCRIPHLYCESLKAVIGYARDALTQMKAGGIQAGEVLAIEEAADEKPAAGTGRIP